MQKPQLYLASSSPRRQTLLQQIDISFQCISIQLTEEIHPGESPQQYADRLALAKAQAGWQSPQRLITCPVLGADTIVVFKNKILGKPKNKADGIDMLSMLSGNTHQVLTSIALVQDDQIETACSISNVQFRTITPREIEAYWDTQEPADKAGSYAVQGKAAIFIQRIEGSYSGIMGLPLFETARSLERFGK